MLYCIARGFVVGNFTYLRSPWRWFDFIMVVMTTVTFGSNVFDYRNEYLNEIRSLKAIIILKIISIISGLRTIAIGMLRSIRAMAGIALLTVLFVITTSLVAKELFMGVLLQKCVSDNIPFTLSNIQNKSYWLSDDEGHPISCGNITGSRHCPGGYICLKDSGINQLDYVLLFDTFLSSVFCVFSIITLDDWEKIYKNIFYTAGSFSIFFFAPLIFFGTYFLLNIMLAIVASSYRDILEEEREDSEIKGNVEYFRDMEQFAFNLNNVRLVKYTQAPKRYSPKRCETVTVDVDRHSSEDDLEEMTNYEQSSVEYEVLEKLSFWRRVRMKCYSFIHSPVTETFRFFTIVMGTLLLACEHYGMSETFHRFLIHCNQALTCIATLDLFLTIIVYEGGFANDGWRVFDGIVVVFSNIEMFISTFLKLSVFKSLHLIRLMKLSQSLTATKKIVTVISHSLLSLAGLSFILFFVMYIFAVIGTGWLKKEFEQHKQFYIDRWTFLDLFHSLLAIFKILLGEWTDSMYDCITVMTERKLICATLIISCFLIGYFVILNLFMAVLLGGFKIETFKDTRDEDTENTRQVVKYLKQKLKRFSFWRKNKRRSRRRTIFGISDKSILEKQISEMHSLCPRIVRNISRGLRLKTKSITESKCFEILSLITIVVSTIPICFPLSSLQADSKLSRVVGTTNNCFTALFVVETTMRIFALDTCISGFLLFDFCIMLLCVISVFFGRIFGIRLVTVRVFRLLRILKSIQRLTRWTKLRVVTKAVLLSVGSVFKVLLICLYIWLTFAILRVQIFSGKLWYCADDDKNKLMSDVIDKRTDCDGELHVVNTKN
ncbi:sodium channel protein 1 brain-like [Centruroides vittatus]|uniref:sodium channel protein 1 brain-like n=1 Tax=Centruroides vittatus TaxID=120091 RepID=UPI00350FC3F5